MKLHKIVMIWVCLAMAGHTLADELNVADLNIKPGESKVVSVELSNPDHAYTLLEFTLSLPEGISIAKDGSDEWAVVLNASRFSSSHVLDIEEIDDRVYKFLIFSGSNVAIQGSSGEILSITLTADADAATGTKQGLFFEQLFASVDDTGYEPADKAFNIKIGGLAGDVNKDGTVSIPDVTALVNIILGKDNAAPFQYDHDAADVNDDGSITIPDVTALVNVILGKQ